MKDNWYHLVPDSVVLKALGDRPVMRCMCCGTTYKRGQFTCCAPPKGMASHTWLSLSCWDETGCGKCARHCQCPNKAERLGKGPLAGLCKEFLEAHGR